MKNRDPLWRRFLISLGCRIMNASSILHPPLEADVDWRDHLAWTIESIGSDIFFLGFNRSQEELEMVLRDELPWTCLDDRLRAAYIAENGVPPHLDRYGFADWNTPQLLLTYPGFEHGGFWPEFLRDLDRAQGQGWLYLERGTAEITAPIGELAVERVGLRSFRHKATIERAFNDIQQKRAA